MKKHLLVLLLVSAIFMGCSKSEDATPSIVTLDQTALSLNYDSEHQFIVKQGSAEVSSSTMTWTSSDETVGTVGTSGLFKAKRIGKTTIKAVGNGSTLSADVIINPYSTLCKEPILDFGSSISAIKGKETRTLSLETSTGLAYTGENSKIKNVFYIFETSGMTSAALIFTNTDAVITEAVKFFSERYRYEGTESGMYYFTDKNVVIGLGVSSSLGLSAIYVKNTTGISSTSNLKSVIKVYSQQRESLNLQKMPVQ